MSARRHNQVVGQLGIDGLRGELEAAVRAGRPTSELRIRIAEAEAAQHDRQHAAAQAADADARQAAHHRAAAVEQAADAVLRPIHARLRGILDSFDLPSAPPIIHHSEEPSMISDADNAALQAAARASAEAQAMVAGLQETAAAAENDLAQLDQRITALDAQRAAVSVRRAAGKISPADQGELLVIAMDQESLAEFRARATEAIKAAVTNLDAAQMRAASAGAELTRTERRVQYQAVQARLDQLLNLAREAHGAVLDALGRLDPRDGVNARLAVLATARVSQDLLLGAASNVRNHDDSLRRLGLNVMQPLFRPSDELDQVLLYLRLNALPTS